MNNFNTFFKIFSKFCHNLLNTYSAAVVSDVSVVSVRSVAPSVVVVPSSVAAGVGVAIPPA